MIDEKKCELVINKFFEALKNAKPDYEIEGTGLTYHMTLELIRVSVKESITGNEDLFENLEVGELLLVLLITGVVICGPAILVVSRCYT